MGKPVLENRHMLHAHAQHSKEERNTFHAQNKQAVFPFLAE